MNGNDMIANPTKTKRSVLVIGARGIPDVEGGAEKNAEMLFPFVAAAGYDVSLTALSDKVTIGEFRGVKIIPVPNVRVMNTDKIAYYFKAIKLTWQKRPDIVHLQGLGSAVFLLVYKALGARIVVRYGSADYVVDKWGAIGRLGFRLAEYQMRFADAVIAVTPALADRIAGKGMRDNVFVIANAVDQPTALEHSAQAETPAEEMSPYILTVGRITSQKNIINIIDAFHAFNAKMAGSYKLLLAGGLDDSKYVEELKPLLNDNVKLLGRCDRTTLEGLYRNCAVFINASLHEGNSNAVLEAISRQCPVVLSNILENRDFGLLDEAYFDPLDTESIADALAAAVRDPTHFVVDETKFQSWAEVAARTLAIYEKLPMRKSNVG